MLISFEKGNRRYIANLEKGLVAEVDDLILSLMDAWNEAPWRLEDDYPPWRIVEGMRKLRALQNLGLIPRERALSKASGEERLRVHICHTFIDRAEKLGIQSRIGIYRLIKSLASKACLSIGLPGEKTRLMEAELEGIEILKTPEQPFLSPVRSVPKGCDGILILYSSYSDLIYLRGSSSALMLIKADENLGDIPLRRLDDVLVVVREWDGVICDSSLLREELVRRYPQMEVYLLPPGVDHELFTPIEKPIARRIIARALGREEIIDGKLVLLFGCGVDRIGGMISRIPLRSPQTFFVAVGTKDDLDERDNLIRYEVEDLEDLEALRYLFSAADLGVFPASPLMNLEYPLSAMACGVGMVVVGLSLIHI